MINDINTIYVNITSAVNFQTVNSPAFDQLIEFQNCILNDLILPNPYQSSTNDFIDNFSAKLIKNILNSAVSDKNLVNTFSTILENYIRILILIFELPNLSFLEAATQITNPNNIFYTTLSKKSNPPELYTKIIKLFEMKNFYEQITNTIENNKSLTLKHLSILINLLIAVKVKNGKYCACIKHVFHKVISIFKSYNYNDLREIDDRILNSTLDSIFSVEFDYLNTTESLSFQLDVNIIFAKSDILEKRFNGISKIVSMIKSVPSTQKQICIEVNKNQVLQGILKDFHHQLVNPFVSILIQFIQSEIDIKPYLLAFWDISINQTSSTASEFFIGWNDLILDQKATIVIFKQYSDALFEQISKSLNFPEASFSFLTKISVYANEEQKEQVFNALYTFSSIQNSDISSIITTIKYYMPKDSENTREKIMKESLEMIGNNFHISLARALFQNLQLNSQQSNEYLKSLFSALNSSNCMEIIDILYKLLMQSECILDENQFAKILEFYLPQMEKKSQEVYKFFENTIGCSSTKNCIYTLDMKKQIFKNICELQALNQDHVALTIILYNSINKENKNQEKVGLELLWETAFRTKNETILVFLMSQTTTMEYVETCMRNVQTPGSLNCLYYIIIKLESYANNSIKSFLGMPLINKYIDKDYLIPVQITGYTKITLKLTVNTTYEALKHFLSLYLKVDKNLLILAVNDKIISNFATHISGPMTIDLKLKKSDRTSYEYDWYNELPTLILFSNETYKINLSNFLEDQQVGETVLKILNKMPTLPMFAITFDIDDENDQIKESNDFTNCGWDWNKFLSYEEPNHLIYHLNTIGNNLTLNDIDWVNWFFSTGGAFKLVDLMLKTKDSPFDLLSESKDRKINDKEYLILLLNIRNMLSFNLDDMMNSIIWQIDDKVFTNFLNYVSKLIENEQYNIVSYTLLLIIEKITLIRGIKDTKEVLDSYIELLELTCFHKNKKIQLWATGFIHKKEIQSHNIIIQLLPKAMDKNNSDFINSIISYANDTVEIRDKELVWNTILDSTFKYFSSLKVQNVNDIWKNLNTSYPQENFLQVLFSSFEIIIHSFECEGGGFQEIPRIEELYCFLFDNIIYNKLIYFKITPQLIHLLNLIIRVKPSLIQEEAIPRIMKIQQEMSEIKKSDSSMNQQKNTPLIENYKGPESHIKGLRNLGATCYMASLLQQLYSIPIFRSKLLNLELNVKSQDKTSNNANVNNENVDNIKDTNEIIESNNNNTNSLTEINSNNDLNTLNEIGSSNDSNNNANTLNEISASNDLNNNENALNENISNSNNNEIINNTNSSNEKDENISNTDIINTSNETTNEQSICNNETNTIQESEIHQNEMNTNHQSNVSNPEEDKDDYKWLFELQYLFLKMLIYPTSSSFIDPTNFVKEWKGWDDNPIDPHQQQDAEEYLSLILSRLESKLPIVNTLFQGKILNHLQGEGKFSMYEHDSIEDYLDISLVIKGHKNIASSFEAYKTPDRFEGNNQYVTDRYGAIDATQTHLILKQSPILIITLKRFQFNMRTLVKEKICSRYEFPLNLDISSILVDNENQENETKKQSSKYELYGVILHMGTGNAGHYISHVKGSDDNWRIFNDSVVQIETVKEMLNACYGGNNESQVYDENGQPVQYDYGSAYILFYRQVDYDFNEGNLPVAPQLIERLADDIKKDILIEISSSEEYFNFITTINQDPEFLFSLLLPKSGVSSKCCSIVVKKCFDKCKESKDFVESILSYYKEKSTNFLLNKDGEIYQDIIINNSIISLIKEALLSPFVSPSISQEFIDFLVLKIKETESINDSNESINKKLNIYTNNIYTFFEIVERKNNQIDTSKSVNILTDFLSKNKCRTIGSIINLIIKMDSNNKQGIDNIAKFFNDEMLLNYFIIDESKEFLSLMIKRIKEDHSKLDLILNLSPENVNSSFVLGKIFICILSAKNIQDNKNYMEIFFSKFLKNTNSNDICLMLEYVISHLTSFIEVCFDSFVRYSDFLIDKFIFSCSSDVRAHGCSLFLKFIFIEEVKNLQITKNRIETMKKSLVKVYVSMINRLDTLRKKIVSMASNDSYIKLKKELPVEHYFQLLTHIVNTCNLSETVATTQSENLAKFLINTSASFYRFNEPFFVRKCVLDFITETISDKESIQFFGENGEILQLFMKSLPFFSQEKYYYDENKDLKELEKYSDTYIKFIVLVPKYLFFCFAKSDFLFEMLKSKKIIQSSLMKNLYKYLCSYFDYFAADQDNKIISNFANQFFSICLSNHLEFGYVFPIKIAIRIMEKFPKLSKLFFSYKYYTTVWSLIYKKIYNHINDISKFGFRIDINVFPLMKLLGVFIRQFSKVPENREANFWLKSDYQTISSYFEQILLNPRNILNVSINESNNINTMINNDTFNSKGSFIFLKSFYMLIAPNKMDEIYEAILPLLNLENGFLSHVPIKAKFEACDLLLTALKCAFEKRKLLDIGFYKAKIDNELACYMNYISQRDSLLAPSVSTSGGKSQRIVSIKEKKIDRNVLNLLSKESFNNYIHTNVQSLNKLFNAFNCLMHYIDGVYYFNSDSLIDLCSKILIRNKVDPTEWIHIIQLYILDLIKNDYSIGRVNEFKVAANLFKKIKEIFKIDKIPEIDMSENDKKNYELWTQKAEIDDYQVAIDFIIVFEPK